jgi:hypothetical protein
MQCTPTAAAPAKTCGHCSAPSRSPALWPVLEHYPWMDARGILCQDALLCKLAERTTVVQAGLNGVMVHALCSRLTVRRDQCRCSEGDDAWASAGCMQQKHTAAPVGQEWRKLAVSWPLGRRSAAYQ